MKVRVFKRPRIVEEGLYVNTSREGVIFHEDKPPHFHFTTSVSYLGKPARMYFNGHHNNIKVNDFANQLNPFLPILIRGEIRIVTKKSKKFLMQVWEDADKVSKLIQHIDLSEPPILEEFGIRSIRTHIFTASEADMFAIRLCL